MEAFCLRLGGYRQQFCFGALPVFDDYGNLALRENEPFNFWGVTVRDTAHLAELIVEIKVLV